MMQAGHNNAATSVNFFVFACNYCQKELKEKAVIKPTYFLTGDFELRTLHVCLFMVGSMFHCRQQWKPMHASTNKPVLLAALLLALAPALSQAADAALTPPPSAQLSSPVAKLPSLASTAKAGGDDGYKETDVWGRIRTGFAIPDLNNELVAKHITWYASRPDYIARTSARASLYLFHVVTELEKRGMPTELALLPFIESAFNPNALSSANAAGMWQFVPGTGRDLNLKQTAFKDDRRGIIASTDAALTYLQSLYDMFGDWQLALAAYNWGQGSVQKAIARNQAAGKPTDFESLDRKSTRLNSSHTEIYTLSLHDALPIWRLATGAGRLQLGPGFGAEGHRPQPGGRQADRLREPGRPDASRDPQLRAQAAGGEEHHRQSGTVRRDPAADRQHALLHRRRQDRRHRPEHRRPASRNVGRRVQGAEPAVQASRHHRRRTDQDFATDRKRRQVPPEPGAMGPRAVDLDHDQDHQRPRTHRNAGLALPHDAGSDTPGQQHPAENRAGGRFDHPGAENFDLGQRRHHVGSGRQRHRRLRGRPRRQAQQLQAGQGPPRR